MCRREDVHDGYAAYIDLTSLPADGSQSRTTESLPPDAMSDLIGCHEIVFTSCAWPAHDTQRYHKCPPPRRGTHNTPFSSTSTFCSQKLYTRISPSSPPEAKRVSSGLNLHVHSPTATVTLRQQRWHLQQLLTRMHGQAHRES